MLTLYINLSVSQVQPESAEFARVLSDVNFDNRLS